MVNPADLQRWQSVRATMMDLWPIIETAKGEICINRPGQVMLEHPTGWESRELPNLSLDRLLSIARHIASASKQKIDEQTPVLSTTLDTGERVQIVIPPACAAGTVTMVFRKPSGADIPFEVYGESGYYEGTRLSGGMTAAAVEANSLLPHERELSRLFLGGEIDTFLRMCVKHRQNVVVSGATGSGKTTFMKSMANLIPFQERLVTIEDARELLLPNHENKVHLFYSRGDQGISKATAKDLLEACLRLYPSRVLLAELRGEEAWYYVRNVMSGHPGSITSMHAADELTVFDQLTLLIKESAAGATVSRDDLKSMLFGAIDVTLQVEKTKAGRRCTGIYYNPLRKRGING